MRVRIVVQDNVPQALDVLGPWGLGRRCDAISECAGLGSGARSQRASGTSLDEVAVMAAIQKYGEERQCLFWSAVQLAF